VIVLWLALTFTLSFLLPMSFFVLFRTGAALDPGFMMLSLFGPPIVSYGICSRAHPRMASSKASCVVVILAATAMILAELWVVLGSRGGA
jgi:hypothetical protein